MRTSGVWYRRLYFVLERSVQVGGISRRSLLSISTTYCFVHKYPSYRQKRCGKCAHLFTIALRVLERRLLDGLTNALQLFEQIRLDH